MINLLQGEPFMKKTDTFMKKLSDNDVSILMFSDGINEDLKGLKIKNIPLGKWPRAYNGTQVAINIVDAFKEIVGSEHSENICIINGLAMDSKGTLPSPSEEILYDTSCLEDSYQFNIVILPPSPSPKKTLDCLLDIRRRCICLAAARRNENEAVSSEVIAVGVSNFHDDMITSGVLDFCVPLGKHQNIEEGVGTAAGIIAGLLLKIKETGIIKNIQYSGSGC